MLLHTYFSRLRNYLWRHGHIVSVLLPLLKTLLVNDGWVINWHKTVVKPSLTQVKLDFAAAMVYAAIMISPGLQKIRNTTGLAARIAEGLGVTPQAISDWGRIPAERVLSVEKITGIPRGELRPDLYPKGK